MAPSDFLGNDKVGNNKPAKPWIISLSTPLYLATTVFALVAILLIVFSSPDGFEETRGYSPDWNFQDDPFAIPNIVLLFSVLTGPIRCFFWAWSFCVQTKWVQQPTKATDGEIRLGDDGEEDAKEGWVKKLLLSYNAWLALALAASVAFSIWRLIENAGGRILMVTTGFALVIMAIDW